MALLAKMTAGATASGLALTMLLMAGCQTAPKGYALKTVSEADRQAEALRPVACETMLLAEPTPCPEPAVASYRIDPAFRYGRFCGRHHPMLRHESGKPEEALNDEERLTLARQFYRITPIDDIDEACREHDVCWLLNPGDQVACNRRLHDDLTRIRTAMTRLVRWYDLDNTPARCGALALDLAYATHLMDVSSPDDGRYWAAQLSRYLTAPLTAMYAGVFLMGSGFDNYPFASERCSVAALRKGPVQASRDDEGQGLATAAAPAP